MEKVFLRSQSRLTKPNALHFRERMREVLNDPDGQVVAYVTAAYHCDPATVFVGLADGVELTEEQYALIKSVAEEWEVEDAPPEG